MLNNLLLICMKIWNWYRCSGQKTALYLKKNEKGPMNWRARNLEILYHLRKIRRPPTSYRIVDVCMYNTVSNRFMNFRVKCLHFFLDEFTKRRRTHSSRRHCFKQTLNHMLEQKTQRSGTMRRSKRNPPRLQCWWCSFIKTVPLSAITWPYNVSIHSYLLRRFNHWMSTNLMASFLSCSSRLFNLYEAMYKTN